jgi:unsaturated rhamnogalacturonyl hydrolase
MNKGMRKKGWIWAGIFFLLAGTTKAGAQGWAQKAAATIMRLWPDSLSGNGRPAHWTYDQGVILKGMEGLWYATGSGDYYRYIEKSLDLFVQNDGSIKTYKLDDYNIDNILSGRALLTLYNVSGKEKYYKAASLLRSQLLTQPRTSEGGFWHKKRYPMQMWLDGLYMGEPFYAEYAKLFHQDTAFNDIARQFILMEKHARDAATGLLYHGWDESRKEKWSDPVTGRSANFWARGMGWYGMALVDALEHFPATHPQRPALLQVLQRYADAVLKVQDAQNGLWWDVLNMPHKGANYVEASASCMFVYTLAKAVRLGYLPGTYFKAAQKGYNGILHAFIETDAAGQLNLKGTVSVSGLGGDPYRDGSFDYYMKEKVVVNDPKGLGAFLLVSNEMELAAVPKTGSGKTVLLDSYFNNEERKDITGAPQSFHYKWEEMDNNGFSIWGFAFRARGAKLETLYQAPAADRLKGKDVYIIVDPDTKAETPQPNFMDAAAAQQVFDWVKAGGTLVMMMNDSANTEFTHFNLLAEKFGMHFNQDFRNKVTGNQFEMGALFLPQGDAIFKTARKVYLKEICTIKVQPPARAHFTEGGDIIMATAQVGKGRVFAVTDPWLYNEYTDGRKLPPGFENYKAAQDLADWLLKGK